MGRFLVTCWPFTGHVLPQLSIATALRERGHEVAFYTGETARDTIESAGFPVFGFSAVDERLAYSLVGMLEQGWPDSRPKPGLLRDTLRRWLVETIPDQLADLEPLLHRWQPDVLVTDLSMWAPILVLWQRDHIPVALSCTFMGPLIPGPDAPPWGFGLAPAHHGWTRLRNHILHRLTDLAATGVRRRIDTIRAEHDLPPLGQSVNAFTAQLPLYLVGNIPQLDHNRTDLPPTVHYVGPCIWHPPTTHTDTTWLDTIPTDTPWIHVTESTLRHGDPFLLRAAIQGLAGEPVQVIATTGTHRDPDTLDLGPTAPNIHLTRWLSHTHLLPRCAAVITTGGAATIMAALQHGKPLIITPTTWDKPDNARRITNAGLGIHLNPKHCTPHTLRTAVQELLTNPTYHHNAHTIAQQLATTNGPTHAAHLLENLTTHRRTAPEPQRRRAPHARRET
ncbi:glycosyltransferase [Micromonospora sp. FIMYZ51]|uniref:glycosyltransferase n=1 Tax=Micromonospora sp. FIMYZ51 TaxID=3051832 RepID=UPI00311F06A8